MMSTYDIDPGSYLPKVMTMTDFNLWTWNSRVFPGIDPLVVRRGDRVRVRIGNLTMTNHPIHLHGHHFEVTCTDGGWVPRKRAEAGGHDRRAGRRHARLRIRRRRARRLGVPLPQGAPHDERDGSRREDLHRRAEQRDLAKAIRKLVPDYMPMGSTGMAEMGAMEMPMPDNTLPMMTGFGQFGPIEMGGMFSVVKVREGLARDDYRDPVGTSTRQARSPTSSKDAVPECAEPQERYSTGTTGNRSHGRETGNEQAHGQTTLTRRTDMMRIFLTTITAALLFGAAVLPALAHEGEHFSAGEPGNPKKPARVVAVTMREDDGKMLFIPAQIDVRKGEQVRFIIRNNGLLKHEFTLASVQDNDKHAELMKKYPDMEHDDPNGKTIEPAKVAEIIWRFTKGGEIRICLLNSRAPRSRHARARDGEMRPNSIKMGDIDHETKYTAAALSSWLVLLNRLSWGTLGRRLR